MKILVLNCGSSSIKYALYDMDDRSVMTQGGIERVGMEGAFVKVKLPNGEKRTIEHDIPEHTEGVKLIFSLLTDKAIGAIKSLEEIDAVGHRMVHAGEKFAHSVVIDDEVIKAYEECIDLAPLHNPANLKGVNAVRSLMPNMPQVGVFDTAFHQTMPKHAFMYALPYELYEKYGIRRYGFHGTSHRYVSARACEYLGLDYEKQRIITCHIGNGGSVAAIKNGKCIDTSMGLTPLEGIMMGTRSGNVDAGALVYLQKKLGLSADELSDLLNKKSGMLGISGISSDMREVREAAENGNERAKLAISMYTYCIKKYVGAYAAAMGGCDIIVFTAGVGENQDIVRELVCTDMEYMGVEMDVEKNSKIRAEEAVLSMPESKVKIVLIPTDEELMIASDTMSLVSNMK
ncbi:MAG: acetate kinase [Prevotella sp.]|nr:acetate kinase [Prevotella sp.]